MAEWVAAVGTVGALLAAVWAIRLQVRELRLQREELALQRHELGRSVEMHELMAQVELARLGEQGMDRVAESLAYSFFRLERDDDGYVLSVQNRSNWRMAGIRLLLFGHTDRPESFVYEWPAETVFVAYPEPVEFHMDDQTVNANASVSLSAKPSTPPLGVESIRLQFDESDFAVLGYAATFIAAGRFWLATNSGGTWGSQLAIHPIDVDGPMMVGEFCREHDVSLLGVRS